MVTIHFAKVILESIFVHRMSGRTIPLRKTLWGMLFYWFLFGCVVGFTLFSPLYKPFYLIEDFQTGQQKHWFTTIIMVIFAVSEFMNFMCHLHFTNISEKMIKSVLRSSGGPAKQTKKSRIRRS